MGNTFDRSLSHLHPLLRALVPVIQARYAAAHPGYRLFVAETRRPVAEQASRYAQGSTKCDGVRSFSMHNFDVAYAVDLWVQDGTKLKDLWPVTWKKTYYNDLGAIIHGLASEGHAIEWGGDFKGFYDGPHCACRKPVLHADLQRALTSAGFPLVADGAWGPKSQAAARAFMHGEDGRASPALFAELVERWYIAAEGLS